MKKAILVVSFGTTHKDALKSTIGKIEDRVRKSFKEYEVRRAFTARKIISVLESRDRIYVDTIEEALERLKQEGFEEVVVQPLYIIPGEEYDYVKSVVEVYRTKDIFKNIELGRPALYFKGINEDVPDDYGIVVDAVKELLPRDSAALFMGHGSLHPSNACYSCLQNVFLDKGFDNVYLGVIEGYPKLQDVIGYLKKDKQKQVMLIPMMLVAGEHVKNEMGSDREKSWYSILLNEGIKVNVCLKGLGELERFQDIYIKHIEDVIEGRYLTFERTKKIIR